MKAYPVSQEPVCSLAQGENKLGNQYHDHERNIAVSYTGIDKRLG